MMCGECRGLVAYGAIWCERTVRVCLRVRVCSERPPQAPVCGEWACGREREARVYMVLQRRVCGDESGVKAHVKRSAATELAVRRSEAGDRGRVFAKSYRYTTAHYYNTLEDHGRFSTLHSADSRDRSTKHGSSYNRKTPHDTACLRDVASYGRHHRHRRRDSGHGLPRLQLPPFYIVL